MGSAYLFIANSPIMILLCSCAILFAMFQSLLFFNIAKKQAQTLGITTKEIQQVVKSSAIFSVVPSLPIIISYMILVPALGHYFPWLRLSVIGSASYETMVANMAVNSFGFESLSTSMLTPDIYGMIMWVVTLGMFLSSMAVLVLKKYDQKLASIGQKKKGMQTMIGNVMFLGMMASLSAPYLVKVNDIENVTTIIVSSGSMLLFDQISKKVPVIKEFAFSISMILGMASACTIHQIH